MGRKEYYALARASHIVGFCTGGGRWERLAGAPGRAQQQHCANPPFAPAVKLHGRRDQGRRPPRPVARSTTCTLVSCTTIPLSVVRIGQSLVPSYALVIRSFNVHVLGDGMAHVAQPFSPREGEVCHFSLSGSADKEQRPNRPLVNP